MQSVLPEVKSSEIAGTRLSNDCLISIFLDAPMTPQLLAFSLHWCVLKAVDLYTTPIQVGSALHPSTLFIPSPTHLATRPHCGNVVSMMLAVKATLSRRRDLSSTCFVCRRRDLWLALARQARLVKQRCPLKKGFLTSLVWEI